MNQHSTPDRGAGTDLASAWLGAAVEARQAGQPHQPWCAGHAWMLAAGVVGALEPLLRDEPFDDSFLRFTALGPEIAQDLLKLLPPSYLAMSRQNDGPTIGTVLRAVVAHQGDLLAHGYLIGPARCDERITVEGVLFSTIRQYRLCPVHGPPVDHCQCQALIDLMRSEFGVDDARVSPHELSRWPEPATPDGRVWYRAWWD